MLVLEVFDKIHSLNRTRNIIIADSNIFVNFAVLLHME